mgnify:CR=1 FL=1
MKILICGDRNWRNRASIKRELLRFDPTTDIVIHGAARGADSIAGDIAMLRGFPVQSFPAKWDEYGRAAGPIRNKLMLDQKPDLVVAFHPNISISKGTGNMVKIARAAGVPVEVFTE